MTPTDSRLLIGGLFLVLAIAGCGGRDQRLVEVSQESLRRQAEQNEQMSRQNEVFAETTQKLIEADANARREALEFQHGVEAERKSLDRQHEDMEKERRTIAVSRQRDPIIANAIAGCVVLLATCLPLVLCLFLVKSLYGRNETENLEELLIAEIAGTGSALLKLSDTPRLEQSNLTSKDASDGLPAPPRLPAPLPSSGFRQTGPRPLLVVVEGKHDIEFLTRISGILRADDPRIPDLAEWESKGRLVFLPIGGQAGCQSTERLAGLGHLAFHLLDREIGPLAQERRQSAAVTNARPGCRAVITRKRAIENYLHPDAIREARGIAVSFNDNDDVPELVASGMLRETQGPGSQNLSRRARRRLRDKVKHWLNTEAVDRMTPERLAERDPEGEVRSWLMEIAESSSVSSG